MRVHVNGDEREVPDGVTIAELVAHLGLGGGPVAVERNRDVVPRAQHATTKVNEGDRIEVVHFVGGG